MNRKHRVAPKYVWLAAGMAAVMLTVSHSQVLAKSDEKSNDPCERLRDLPGKELGLKKRCAVGSSSGVARADFNHDGYGDLAIGVPYEDVVTTQDGTNYLNLVEAGEVDVLYGSGSGLSKAERVPQMWHQDRPNVGDKVEAGDHFGFTLSAWNFSGPDVLPDLAIGVPLEDVNGVNNCGAVAVLYSTSANNGLSSLGDQLWHPHVANVPGSCQTNGKFGAAMY